MSRSAKFVLTFAPEALGHLDGIERKFHGLIKRTIDEQLGHTPHAVTRNRKPLEEPAPFKATWELRCGPNNRFRVFYDVDEFERSVWILAIGVKEGHRLFIAGEEFKP